MKLPLTLLSILFSLLSISQPTWLRYPSISPDGKNIVFTYKGDLYKVATSGGSATQLTQHEAHDFMPVWSHDGKWIAFASDRFGNFDIWLMPAEGGEAKRLTFHSSNEYPYDFTSDNKQVIFGATRMDLASNRGYPTGSQPELYEVSTNGGRVHQIFSTPAEDVKTSANGQFLIYHDKKGGENAWRKHHISAIARDIWVYDTKTGTHKKITDNAGEDRNPILADNDKTVYYLSESGGSFNVSKMSLDNPGSTKQLTSFKKHPIRFLSRSNDGMLCFSYDGELYTMKDGGNPQKLKVEILADAKSNNEKILTVNGGAGDLAVSPNGKEVAFVFRGEVFVTSVEGGVTKRITNSPAQERGVSFSPDGRNLLYSSERGNAWKIYQTTISRKEEPYFYASTVLTETPIIENDKENYQPEYSPDGKEIAFIEGRTTLKVYNIASKQTRTILTSKELFSWRDNDQTFDWSPDGKWFSFDYSMEGAGNGEIGIISSDGNGKPMNLTQNGFDEGSPKWMQGGKMIIYASDREGLRAKANSGGSQRDVYALFLTQDAWDKFKLSKEDYALVKEQDEKAAKADSSKKTKKDSTLIIDWDGLKDRKARLTINSSSLGDALVSKDGETLYYLTRFEKGLNLWSTNLRTKETKILVPLNANGGTITWDKEQKNIFLLSDGAISKIDPASGKRDMVSINGEMNLDVAAERRFMFEHVWRRTKTTFYTASFHGVDWDSYKADYEKYLPSIGNNYEFAEMMSELLGELNVSHSGSTYGPSSPTGDATASLGAFYDQDYVGNGVRIAEVIKEGPLDKAGLGIKAGMIIESIDGVAITADKDLCQYLNRKAGKNVLLSLSDGTQKKDIIIKPISIGEESGLLYKRWVRRNQDEVDSLSHGTLGYVHLPGMNDGAYRTTYEEVMGKYANRKGIVIDTRFNSGGDLVSDLATFLTGKAYMMNANDKRVISYEPTFRWNGLSIAMANEANYSDGHCFAFGYQNLKIGKLVGMPVPGTCTFAGWETLQDNSIRWGVPPVGVKRMDGHYLENSPTEPDIKVRNDFTLMSKGKDEQLEVAVRELMKEAGNQ